MVIKKLKRHLGIHMDYFKLHLRNRRKVSRCPICEKKFEEIKTMILCSKCDDKFSRFNDKRKKKIVNNVTSIHSKKKCFMCKEKGLENENKLIYCTNCDISFHL
jgi:hypothetical protein